MALINCPECKKEVSDSALSCPHCGFQLKEKEKVVKSQVKIPKKKHSAFLTWVIIIAILMTIFYITYIGSVEDNSSSNNSSSTNKFVAYSYAEDFVKQNLKSPSTADFSKCFGKRPTYN